MDERPLGERVREYRALHCLSLRKFAEIAKLGYLTVYNIERYPDWKPTYATVTRIECILSGGKLPE